MQKIILFIAVVFTVAITKAQTANPDINKVMEFSNASYDFGKIPFGKPVEYDVLIKNISKDSIWIDNVKVGCGCTTPKYEQGKKFAPGETIKLTLGFNGGTMGVFSKYADIYFNNNTLSKQVTFKGETYTANSNPSTSTATQTMKPTGN
jgi:hypothetical protein